MQGDSKLRLSFSPLTAGPLLVQLYVAPLSSVERCQFTSAEDLAHCGAGALALFKSDPPLLVTGYSCSIFTIYLQHAGVKHTQEGHKFGSSPLKFLLVMNGLLKRPL